MNKNFNLHTGLATNLCGLFQSEFTRRHNAFEAHCLQGTRAGQRGARQLRGSVQRNLGELTMDTRRQTQVLHNHAVHRQRFQERQRRQQCLHFMSLNQRIECHIDLAGAFQITRIGNHLRQLFIREVGRIRTRRETGQPQVHRICAIGEGGDCGIKGTCRGEKFGKLHTIHPIH